MPSDKPIITLRLSEDIREKLRYLAAHEHRSMNSEIAYCIEYYLDAWESINGKIPVGEE